MRQSKSNSPERPVIGDEQQHGFLQAMHVVAAGARILEESLGEIGRARQRGALTSSAAVATVGAACRALLPVNREKDAGRIEGARSATSAICEILNEDAWSATTRFKKMRTASDIDRPSRPARQSPVPSCRRRHGCEAWRCG